MFRFAACQFGRKTAGRGSPPSLGCIVRAVARLFARSTGAPVHVATWKIDLIFIISTAEHGECASLSLPMPEALVAEVPARVGPGTGSGLTGPMALRRSRAARAAGPDHDGPAARRAVLTSWLAPRPPDRAVTSRAMGGRCCHRQSIASNSPLPPQRPEPDGSPEEFKPDPVQPQLPGFQV